MEPEGLGISWLWKLPNTHPFYKAGVNHDRAYDNKISKTSFEADQIFLKECLSVASTVWLKTQAYTFYYLARAWGLVNWNKAGSRSCFCSASLEEAVN
jgi:hypothetical protein